MKNLQRTIMAAVYLFTLTIPPTQAQSNTENVPSLVNVTASGDSIELDLTQLMPYDIFTLSSPWRLIIEIPGTKYQTSFSRKTVNTQLIRRIRGYQFKENPLIARVVLDLKEPVDYSASASDSKVIVNLRKNEVLSQQNQPKKPKKQSVTIKKRNLLDNLPKEVVSLDFESADVRDVIRLMAETSNINMIFGPEVGGNISVHLKKVPFDEAFRTILNLRGLVATQLGRNILRITTPDNLKEDKTKAVVYTKIIPVSYVDANEMKNHIVSVMATSGRKGTITVVNETNSLVITDSQEGLSQSERLIQQLDLKPRQVLIESRIVEINLNNGFDIGIQWEYAKNKVTNTKKSFVGIDDTGARIGHDALFGRENNAGALGPSSSGTGVSLPGPTNVGITFGFVKSQEVLAATLSALVTSSKARILASPKVVTINGQRAQIEAVQDIPFRTSTVSGTGVVSNSFQTVSAGIILKVTPTINADDRITLEITPESSFPTQESTEAGPIIRTRNAKTTVIIKNGETLVIGGLIDDQDTTGVTKIPILGDIPILGAFFRSQTTRKIRNELIVLVTPRIIVD